MDVGAVEAVTPATFCCARAILAASPGGIWVYGEEALAEGDAVYCRVAAGTASVLGGFRNDSDSSSCILIPGARVERDTTAAGPAQISLPFYFGA